MKKTSVLISMILMTVLLCGCQSGKKELATYKKSMEQFFENVNTIDQAINSIDPSSDNASAELLGYLDALDKSFNQMATLKAPAGFTGADEYAADAAQCMTQAVSYYHEAYEGEFNAQSEDIASQYYQRANNDIRKLVQILHGELKLEVTYDDEPSDSEASEETEETGSE